jgi:hypothetical protein
MDMPLSYEQEAHLLLNEGPYSAISMAFRVRGPLAPALLARAAAELTRRHEALRLRLRGDADGVRQAFLSPRELTVPVREFTAAGDDEARRVVCERSVRRFDLRREPGLEVSVVTAGAGTTWVLLLADHLCVDGWGGYLLARDLWQAYAALAERGATARTGAKGLPTLAVLPEATYGYGDYVRAQRARPATPRGDESRRRYWREIAARYADAGRVPADTSAGSATSEPAGSAAVDAGCAAVDASSAAAIGALATRVGVSANIILLACFALAAAAEAAAPRLGLWFSYAGRDRQELHDLVGLVYRRVPLVLDCARGGSLGGFLADVQREWYEAVRNSRLPYTPMMFADDPRLSESRAGAEVLYNQVTYFGVGPGKDQATIGGTHVTRKDIYYDPARWRHYREPRTRVIVHADDGVRLQAIVGGAASADTATGRIMRRTGELLAKISPEAADTPLDSFAA